MSASVNSRNTNLAIFKGLDLLSLCGIIMVSFIAIILQITKHELPCPLCLLQRIGILAIGFAYMLNLLESPKVRNYALANVAAVITCIVAVRQVVLNISPDITPYGIPFLGKELYTWTVVLCIINILWNSILIYIINNNSGTNVSTKIDFIPKVIIGLYILVIVLNIVSTFLECGLTQCPDNPISYMIFLH